MPIQESSARQRAYEFIQEKILSGHWPGGTVVSELALSREMGSSRTPIREAVRQLAGEGFLEQAPNRAMAVAKLTRADIAEIYELREALEVYAVGKAASSRVAAPVIDRLRSFLRECESLGLALDKTRRSRLNQEQMSKFIQADLGFHTLLLHAAANQRMLKVVSETRLLMRTFSIRREGHSVSQLCTIHDEHQAILAAVEGGRAEEARTLLAGHIRASCQERMEAYDHWERERALDSWSR